MPASLHRWAVSESSSEACQGWRAGTSAHREDRIAVWSKWPFGWGRSGTRLGWPPVLVSSGPQGFPGCRTFSVKVGESPGLSLSWGSSRGTGPCGFLDRGVGGPGSSALCTCWPHSSSLKPDSRFASSLKLRPQVSDDLRTAEFGAHFRSNHCISHSGS